MLKSDTALYHFCTINSIQKKYLRFSFDSPSYFFMQNCEMSPDTSDDTVYSRSQKKYLYSRTDMIADYCKQYHSVIVFMLLFYFELVV